ncbi:DNA repair protein Rad5p [[Candida] jaroonii]|uniref:DNA repair protein Rad5p n=1 Tax=[Candida] jaroonii TaxID=467808 RepID=A0ACA9Y9M8_9ASCO|nr:DNA repair protein Rad5p [[Candida] jaroonii]
MSGGRKRGLPDGSNSQDMNSNPKETKRRSKRLDSLYSNQAKSMTQEPEIIVLSSEDEIEESDISPEEELQQQQNGEPNDNYGSEDTDVFHDAQSSVANTIDEPQDITNIESLSDDSEDLEGLEEKTLPENDEDSETDHEIIPQVNNGQINQGSTQPVFEQQQPPPQIEQLAEQQPPTGNSFAQQPTFDRPYVQQPQEEPVSVDDDYSDDDLMIISPEEANKLSVFNKPKSLQAITPQPYDIHGNPGFNQPAPIPRYGPDASEEARKRRSVEREIRLRDLAFERNRSIVARDRIQERLQDIKRIIANLNAISNSSGEMSASLGKERNEFIRLNHQHDLLVHAIRNNEMDSMALLREKELEERTVKEEQYGQNSQRTHQTGMPPPPQPSVFNTLTDMGYQMYNQFKDNFQPLTTALPPGTTIGPTTYDTSQVHLNDLIDNIVEEEHNTEGDDFAATPSGLSTVLLKHQRIGLSWLLKMEESSIKGGILADDMGLGKTIQALALILANKSEDQECKTTLVIAPVSLLRQWKQEMQDKVDSSSQLSIGIYHGKEKNMMKTPNQFRKFDVVLTSYGTLSSEHGKHGSKVRSRQFYSPFYHEMKFFRIILDEAQAIKNRNTRASKAVADLESVHRLCLTGTPMQNSVNELYPIIRFLKARPYNDLQKFNLSISGPITSQNGNRTKGVERLQALLKAICLRRTKDSLIDGKPILQLPEKHVHIDRLAMPTDEKDAYKSIESRTGKKAKRLLSSNGSWSHILVLLTRLRQACLHTYLCELGSIDAACRFKKDYWKILLRTVVDLDDVSVQKIKLEINKGHFDSEDMKDIHDMDLIQEDKIVILSDEEDEEEEDAETNQEEVKEEDKQEVKEETKPIIETKERNELFKTEINQMIGNEESFSFTCPICVMPANWSSILRFPCGHKICDVCIQEFFPNLEEDDIDASEKCRECPQRVKLGDVVDYSIFAKKYVENLDINTIKNQLYSSYNDKMTNQDKILKLAEKYDGLEPSCKMSRIMDLIEKIFKEYPGEKIIIFSQFIGFFDILTFMLKSSKIPYLRYDGSMTVDKKDFAVKQFYQSDVKIMLTSLKAGNAGLTLTCASHVILCDPFWNPFVEEQAMGRAHRLGQQREVHVYRILIEDTVEDRIVKLQQQKKELIEAALDEKGIQSVSKLGRRELGFLFGLNGLD